MGEGRNMGVAIVVEVGTGVRSGRWRFVGCRREVADVAETGEAIVMKRFANDGGFSSACIGASVALILRSAQLV